MVIVLLKGEINVHEMRDIGYSYRPDYHAASREIELVAEYDSTVGMSLLYAHNARREDTADMLWAAGVAMSLLEYADARGVRVEAADDVAFVRAVVDAAVIAR